MLRSRAGGEGMGREMTGITLFGLKKRDSGHRGICLMRKGETCVALKVEFAFQHTVKNLRVFAGVRLIEAIVTAHD